MALTSQASHAIVPANTYSSVPTQGLAAHCNEYDQEQLSGYIFMCNAITKPQCYMYRVFGLPRGKLEVIKRIKPGMKLFLFDFEKKLLYGVYEATSVGTLDLEQNAFVGKFPAQVRFKIYRDCLPLHESSFRHAIETSYQKGSKFKQELNMHQVGSLLSLFCPLMESTPCSLQPMLQAEQNKSRLPFSKSSYVQVLEPQQVQQAGLQQGTCCVYQINPNVTGLQLSYVQPVSEPQKILQGVPSLQQHYFGSQQVQQAGLQQGIIGAHPVDPNVTGLQLGYVQPVVEPRSATFLQQHYFGSSTHVGHSYPTMVTQVLLGSNSQYYEAQVQQPYAAGNPSQTM